MPGHIPDPPALGSELSRPPGEACRRTRLPFLPGQVSPCSFFFFPPVLRSRGWLCLSKTCWNPLSVGFPYLLELSPGTPEFYYAYYLPCEVGLPFICPKPVWLVLQREPPPPVSCRLVTEAVPSPLSHRLPSSCVSLYPCVPPHASGCSHQRPPN